MTPDATGYLVLKRPDGFGDVLPLTENRRYTAGRATDSDVHVGQVATWDVFYADRPELRERLTDYGVLAVEMETSALYTLAAKHGARAAAVCTVSDSLVTQEETSAQERERTFSTMVQAALRAVTQIG